MLDFLSLPSVALDARLDLPECSGIYFVIAFDGVAREVLYIGKAKNINARWQVHHRLPDVSRRSGVSIFWLQVDDVSNLDNLEREFIKYFEPTLNGKREIPEGDEAIDILIPIKGWVFNLFARRAEAQLRTPRQQLAFELEEWARGLADLPHDEEGQADAPAGACRSARLDPLRVAQLTL